MIAIDTNILVYSHRREAPMHLAAVQKMRELAGSAERWAIPWPCVHEFYAVATHPKIWKGAQSTPHEAWTQILAWKKSPTCRFLNENEEYESVFGALVESVKFRGPVVHDARVAAMCIVHGVKELWTADRDFSMFSRLRCRNPLV